MVTGIGRTGDVFSVSILKVWVAEPTVVFGALDSCLRGNDGVGGGILVEVTNLASGAARNM